MSDTPAVPIEAAERVITWSLFGTEDGDHVADETNLPVGELRRLVREVAVPSLVSHGLLVSPDTTRPDTLPPTPWQARDSRVLDADGTELFMVHNVDRWQQDRVAAWLVDVVNQAAACCFSDTAAAVEEPPPLYRYSVPRGTRPMGEPTLAEAERRYRNLAEDVSPNGSICVLLAEYDRRATEIEESTAGLVSAVTALAAYPTTQPDPTLDPIPYEQEKRAMTDPTPVAPLDDPSYEPTHRPTPDGGIPPGVERWGAPSQLRWFLRFRDEMRWQAWTGSAWRYYCDSAEHRGLCCDSCLNDQDEGYYDTWPRCCCRSERSGVPS